MQTDFRTAPPTPADPTLPRISVLVMGHNQEDFMGPCIDSILSQQYAGWAEVILCDDCSTDGTYEVMRRKAEAYKGPFRVVAHRCPVNGRVAVNMNVAVSLSEGDWLMRVDGDDMMHPDRMRLTALAIQRFPGATGISGQRKAFSTEPAPVGNPPDGQLEFLVGKREDYRNGEPKGLSWWGCAMTYSRRIFTEFGDMPAECAVLDDTMFATRILMLGQFVIIRNGCLVHYRRHGGNMSSDDAEPRTIREMLRHDAASRDYRRRGIPCHKPILDELEAYAETHPDCKPMARWFRRRFAEWERQALFWKKSWKARLGDAHITGPWWRKIPWAVRVISPLTYVLGERLQKKRR